MSMKSTLKSTLVSFLITAVMLGQVQKPPVNGGPPVAADAEFSPLPMYPRNGAIPRSLESQFLFLDDHTRELVVSYPDNVDTPNFTQNPGPRREMRVALSRYVSAMIYVSFGKDSSGRTTYGYTVVNTPTAKQDLGVFSLPIASPGSNLPAKAVDSSSVAKDTPVVLEDAGWHATLAAPDKGIVRIDWSEPQAGGIHPGGTLLGLKMASTLKPGFVTATVRGLSTMPKLSQIVVPALVHQALTDLEASGYNERSVLTLGPVFQSTTNRLVIAANLLQGIVVLRQHKYLTKTSPFVTEAIAVLTRYLEGANVAQDGPASQYLGSSLKIQQAPAAGLESQISAAIMLSLEAN